MPSQIGGGNDPVRQAALRQLRVGSSVQPPPTQEQLPQGTPGQAPQPAGAGAPSSQQPGQLAGLLLEILQQAQSPQADLGAALAQAFQMLLAGQGNPNDIETLRAFVKEYAAIRDQIGQAQRSQIDSFLLTIQQVSAPEQGQTPQTPPTQPAPATPGNVPQQGPPTG